METKLKEKKKELIGMLLDKKILLKHELFNTINTLKNTEELDRLVFEIRGLSADAIEPHLKRALIIEKKEEQTKETTKEELTVPSDSGVDVIFSYTEAAKKRSVADFVSYFNKRQSALERILRKRQELQAITSISRVLSKTERETVSVIGIVKDKQKTRRNNILLTLEDTTGEIKVAITGSRPELFEQANDIVLDEVIAVSGTNGNKIIFAQNIIWPDVPANLELKKAPDECYSLFLSDLHVGSINFLEEKFNKFLRWLNGQAGTDEQKQIVKKIKYLFIVGDIVDGIGIYPEQIKELTIKDIRAQYEAAAALLSKIPEHINIIICPGNHDALRISEPQPPLSNEFASALSSMPNVTLVSNPARINIHASENFSGFDVLLYHGFSFDYFIANVDSIRQKGGYDRPDLIMKFVMQRRHLAPSHTSTQYVPDSRQDPLVIETVPDFFVTGHLHKVSVANYKNIITICGSCWQDTTSFQEKIGHKPEPARVPLVNLQTRKIKILRF